MHEIGLSGHIAMQTRFALLSPQKVPDEARYIE
jgi:hypothetical protein